MAKSHQGSRRTTENDTYSLQVYSLMWFCYTSVALFPRGAALSLELSLTPHCFMFNYYFFFFIIVVVFIIKTLTIMLFFSLLTLLLFVLVNTAFCAMHITVIVIVNICNSPWIKKSGKLITGKKCKF